MSLSCQRLIAILLAGLLLAPGAARAEDASKVPPPIDKPAAVDSMGRGNPYAEKLQTMARDLYNTMSQAEMRRLVVVRTGFGMIRSVETAGGDIDAARKLCGDANPTLKSDLDKRYQHWRATVQPAVDNQVRRMQASLSKKNFDDPDKVRAFLDQLDKVAQYAHDQNDKGLQRVTGADACKNLGQSMDDNAPKLAAALEKMTWPGEPGRP